MRMGVRDMMDSVMEESTHAVIATATVVAGPSSPAKESSEAYDEMLERHHDSLIDDDAAQNEEMTADGLFASSVQILYDVNEMKVPFIDLVTSVAVNDNEVIDIASVVAVPLIDLTISSPNTSANTGPEQTDRAPRVGYMKTEDMADNPDSEEAEREGQKEEMPANRTTCELHARLS
ncbi:uncharacterized protein [Triticum aestivum]|uniref:uncharacterized protein n=1 Tax=Triticum aestivum TaxID=4565 RepID=UPI001D033656|nr:uncharacterized protein LOC123062557 [Triticum aestivum]